MPANGTDSQAAKADSMDEQIVRQILCSVEGNAELSQRQLSKELGIALGSVNWYLKRCISKGLIKISQAPLKRYIYYLTPQGFEEKSRLMGQYLKWSLDFFRLGREEATRILERTAAKGYKSVILAGDGDFAEIFILSAMDSALTIEAIFEPDAKQDKHLNIPVFTTPPQIEPAAGYVYVITNMSNPQQAWNTLREAGIPEEDIIVPELLGFRPVQEGDV